MALVEADVTRCVPTDRMAESEFEALLWEKALSCGSVFPVDKLKDICIQGIKSKILQNVCNHWASHPDVELHAI